ncbi:MAG: glycerate kinase [Gordonia sp. (in: high G+C Gram-positive bacteria)]|uniref:glycerate kinase family protein n=1 Tax=Gordonia sp. (in: high G+C Gram-positive bacteria) TaxID=84139 RepID=UPI003C70C78B
MTGHVRRIVIAPDEFGGTLSAAIAARAIASGWHRARPDDVLTLLPQSDGGPGFVDVLSAAMGERGRREQVSVPGPLGTATTAEILVVDGTAYLETAQACGLHLVRADGRQADTDTARRASTAGVGSLLRVAAESGVSRIVVGLGGSATTDGGRGAVEAIGGLARAKTLLRGIELIAATDVTNPLLGDAGAAAVFGPQKGADAATIVELEARLAAWADELEADGPSVRELPGAGAAGGLGALLFALGGRREAGADVVGNATDRARRIAAADLVITGEGRFDQQTAFGKVVASVTSDAHSADVPVVVIAGQVSPGTHVAGVRAAYSMSDAAGSVQRSMDEPEKVLTELATQVAKLEGQMRE